jgi:hypothetical protein
MRTQKYDLRGFQLINTLDAAGYVYRDLAAVSVESGDCLFDDGTGYVTNVGTAFAATFIGIAGVAVDNSAGAAGDVKVPIIPPLPHYKFVVKAESTTLAQTDVGEIVDLQANDSIDPGDTTLVEWGFVIDEIDISTDAVAANTQGFAQGRFQKTPQ